MLHHNTRALLSALILTLSWAGACAVEEEAAKPDGGGGLPDAVVAPDSGVPPADGAAAPDLGQQASGTLTLPANLGLNLAKTATTKGAAGTVAGSVSQAAGFSQELDQVLAIFAKPIDALQIPLSAGVKTHAAKITVGSGSKATQATIKLDFADFDADGDGKQDGCSGHTGALPVCLRVWIDGARYLAGRLDLHPGPQSAGVGRLMVVKVPSLPGGEAGMTVAVVYDHRKPDQRSTELFWGSPADDPKLGKWATIRHLRLAQLGPAATAVKTINMHDVMPSQAGAALQYLGRYREDGKLWYGTVQALGIFAQLGLKAFGLTCVDLTSGATVDPKQCNAAGVAFNNLAVVKAGTDADLTLPAGFPASPTF